MNRNLAGFAAAMVMTGMAMVGAAQGADKPVRVGLALSQSGHLADSAKL